MKPFICTNAKDVMHAVTTKLANIYITPSYQEKLINIIKSPNGALLIYNDYIFIGHYSKGLNVKLNPYTQTIKLYDTASVRFNIIKYVVTEPFEIVLSEPKPDTRKVDVAEMYGTAGNPSWCGKDMQDVISMHDRIISEAVKINKNDFDRIVSTLYDKSIPEQPGVSGNLFTILFNADDFNKKYNDVIYKYLTFDTKSYLESGEYRYCPYCGCSHTHNLDCRLHTTNE